MMKKFITKSVSFFLTLFFLLSCTALSVSATDIPYFTFYSDKNAVVVGDEIRIKVNASENELKENIAAFRVILNFDSSKLTFKRADTSAQVQENAFQYHAQEDKIIGIYACDGRSAPKLLGDCITFVFAVKEAASVGETIVSAQLDQMVDWSVQKLGSVCSDEVKLQIEPPLSPKALLTSLEPLQGTLEPSFSPNTAAYSLSLPSSAASIEFLATAAEDGTVSINRKTLGVAGTKTVITVTVTSADKKSKSQYFVTVSRAEKAVAITASSNQRGTDTQPKKQGGQTVSRASSGSSSSIIHSTDTSRAKETDNLPINEGERNLYMVGNQMPAYVVGMLFACICILIGIFGYHFMKEKKDRHNK